jgi:hypothetical protein
MLVIHAAEDPFVPVHHAHQLAHAGQAGLWITPGTRHLASASAVGSRYAQVVAQFFETALLGAHQQGHVTPAMDFSITPMAHVR